MLPNPHRLLRPLLPDVVAYQYIADLREARRQWQDALRAEVQRTYRDPLQRVARHRADVGLPRIRLRFEAPRRAVAAAAEGVDNHVRRVYDPGGKFLGRKELPREKRKVQGINVRSAAPAVAARIQRFIESNVKEVTTVAASQLDELQALADEAWTSGKHADELAEIIEKRFALSAAQADVIARDQILTLNAQITQARHQAAGIERFVWSTSGDARVRESHAELDGKEFAYDDPPIVDGEPTLPGEAILCRCVAIPVVPELEGIF